MDLRLSQIFYSNTCSTLLASSCGRILKLEWVLSTLQSHARCWQPLFCFSKDSAKCSSSSISWTCWFKLSAAAAKSLQSHPTLCDPIDGSPPGSPVPGILQARTLEWVAISFSNAWKWRVKGKSLSRVWLLATPWTAAYPAPPSMGFSRQEYWSRVPSPSPLAICKSLLLPLIRNTYRESGMRKWGMWMGPAEHWGCAGARWGDLQVRPPLWPMGRHPLWSP